MSDNTPAEPGPKSSTVAERGGNSGFAAFRYRDFRYFYFTKAFAVGTFHMNLVAIGYQIYEMTGDAMALALINLSLAVPAVALSPITGYVADSFDRRRVVVGCYAVLLVTSLGLCALTALAVTELWPFYLTLFLSGAGRAFYGPTSNALLPNVVPIEILPNAIAWNTSAGRTAQILGPPAGGFLYLLGPETVYATAAVTYLLGAIATAMLRPQQSRRLSGRFNLENMFSGIRYVIAKRIILGAVVVDLIMMLMGGVQALLPIFAKDILDVGPTGAGLLRSAMAVGGLLMALILTRYAIRSRAGMKMLVATAFFGAATVVFGVSTWFALSLGAIAVIGACDTFGGNVRLTLMQLGTPDHLRGRVGAVSSLASNMGSEIGGFRAGAFTAIMGPVAAVVVGGVVVVAVATASFKIFPELARVERMDQTARND
jgi:MFS family permease